MAFKPTEAQIAAMRKFADRHGYRWKSKLRKIWMYGATPEVYGELWVLRNVAGPGWLTRFRFPK